MLTIISPAKKQNFEKLNRSELKISKPVMTKQIKELSHNLKKINSKEIQSLMGVSDKIADLNYQRFQDFDPNNFNENNSKPAILALEGDVYKNINPNTLSDEVLNSAQNKLGILSGLYGYLRPLDLIQPYRLEMKTKLKTDKHNNLYSFWADTITNQINAILKEQNITNNYLINLASTEYFSSLDINKINAQIIHITFKELKNSRNIKDAKIIGVMAKRARGMMCRFILENDISNPKDLQKFNLADYKFQKDLSNKGDYIFIAKR